MSYRLSTNMLATARAVNTEISTGTAQSICLVISNTITATDTVPVTPPDGNASCEVSAIKAAQLKSVQLSLKHSGSAHLRMPLPLLLQAALLGYNQSYNSSSFHRPDDPGQHLR